MSSDPPRLTVYFDGSCALCRAEIGYYARHDTAGALCSVDVSQTAISPPHGIDRERAMKRFHVLADDGRLLSGAAAFVEVWKLLPGWRWAAGVMKVPGALAALEVTYRMFLPLRPTLSRLFAKAMRPPWAGQRAGRR
jgi:predicted DCC family thiol-disulfide oxidoreductase YuxK